MSENLAKRFYPLPTRRSIRPLLSQLRLHMRHAHSYSTPILNFSTPLTFSARYQRKVRTSRVVWIV